MGTGSRGGSHGMDRAAGGRLAQVPGGAIADPGGTGVASTPVRTWTLFSRTPITTLGRPVALISYRSQDHTPNAVRNRSCIPNTLFGVADATARLENPPGFRNFGYLRQPDGESSWLRLAVMTVVDRVASTRGTSPLLSSLVIHPLLRQSGRRYDAGTRAACNSSRRTGRRIE